MADIQEMSLFLQITKTVQYEKAQFASTDDLVQTSETIYLK